MLDRHHDTSSQRALHKEIIDWRGEAIAHSDWGSHGFGIDDDGNEEFMLTLVPESLIPDLEAFISLVADMSMAAITRVKMIEATH